MNLFITKEELAQHKHINFSMDLDESGLFISSLPQEVFVPPLIQKSDTGLLTDLNHLTWPELFAIGQKGQARQQIALGATKIDHMKNGYGAEYRIIGFDHDDLADGSGKAPFTWQMTRVFKERRPMNDDCTNEGGWEACTLRKWLNSDFLKLCSDELQSVIRPVSKLTSAGDGSEEIIKSVDRIFILSETEVYGRVFYSVPGEGSWYEYYRLEDVPYLALDDDESAVWLWLRSPSTTGGSGFRRVNADGGSSGTYACTSGGVRPGLSF